MRATPAILALILVLTGCWDLKEAQNVNFVTALGVDYDDGRYVIYAQLLDFAEIAKQEGTVETGNAKVWIGKGEGKTVTEALNSLYPASQQRTLWTHVRAIVFSQALLDKHLKGALNGLIRSRDLRYTPWVFGTDKDIPTVFSSVSLLNESVLNSLLLEPKEIFRQYSFAEPIRLIKFMDGVKEPAVTALLPQISWTDEVWEENGEPVPQVKLTGAYAIAEGRNRGVVDQTMLQGARYVSFKRMSKYPLTLTLNDGSPVTLSIGSPKRDIRIGKGGTGNDVRIRVRLKAYITEIGASSRATAADISALAAKKIEEDIRRSFAAAKSKNIDIYNLEEKLYRYDQARWKRICAGGKPCISRLGLEEVNAEVEIAHSTSYKLPGK
ncbi:Ger(x)C family spore germination protein [Paenibacillus macerans]|uniref:Ger(x)C family spore germination protein n=1 Tax=Paenibacillus macerans TaxID=44252 RepID=UPI003D32214D